MNSIVVMICVNHSVIEGVPIFLKVFLLKCNDIPIIIPRVSVSRILIFRFLGKMKIWDGE